MCEIATLATLASTLIGGMGAIQQGKAQEASAEYEARVNEKNARLAEFSARDAIVRGNAEQKKQLNATQELRGRQRAAMASNNLDTSFGSALDASVDTAMLGELDALTIQSNTYREAYDYKVEASNNENAAEMSRIEGKNAKKASYLNAAGTILTGFGKSYNTYKTNTAFA